MAGHPNVRSRTPANDEYLVRVLALCSDMTLPWVEGELYSEHISLQIARSVPHAVSALVEDPPPRATILVCDFDNLDAAATMQLHEIRERGWFGAVIGLGRIAEALRISLAIGTVLTPPFRTHALRNAVSRAGIGLATTKIPTTSG
jgi:hypothetical protein